MAYFVKICIELNLVYLFCNLYKNKNIDKFRIITINEKKDCFLAFFVI